jgi:hypothetical protein
LSKVDLQQLQPSRVVLCSALLLFVPAFWSAHMAEITPRMADIDRAMSRVMAENRHVERVF